jgi:hypothetical protein
MVSSSGSVSIGFLLFLFRLLVVWLAWLSFFLTVALLYSTFLLIKYITKYVLKKYGASVFVKAVRTWRFVRLHHEQRFLDLLR